MAKPQVTFKDETDRGTFIDKVKLAETQAGKTIQMVRDAFGYWLINFKEGGEVPQCLQGSFTEHHSAMKAVDSYLASRSV
jgi:hypothetical protein